MIHLLLGDCCYVGSLRRCTDVYSSHRTATAVCCIAVPMKDLPQCLLVLVLKRVNLDERLKSCALVSTSWAEAAAMATDNVRSCTSDPKKIVPWLDHHGSQLTSLHLESRCNLSLGPSHSPSQGPSRCSAPLLCALLDPLPCSNLLQLSLRGLPVALGASDGRHPVLLEAATRLTSLELHMRSREDLKVFTFHEWRYVGESRALEDLQACYHFNKADDTNGECDSERLMSLRVLRYLLALQRLDLSVGDDSASLTYQLIGKDYRLTSEIMGCWSTHLTSLSINGVLALDSFQSLSPFTKLQRLYLNLRLGVCKDNWQEADPVLPEPLCQQLQELTHLSLYMEKHNFMEPTKIMGPTLSGCSGLQELYLYAPSVDVSAFEGLTGLRTLHLVADAVFQGAASGVAAVFEHIGRMHHLERLVIAGGFLGATVALGAGDAELCMGLTASVHLKHLDLSGLKLPRSAWMHLFPRGQQLPQLPDFKLCFEERRVFLDGCALEHMAACCHAIDRLSFERMSLFKWDVSLAPLRLLGQLVDLECDGAVDGDASVGALACITSLTRLHMRASGQLSDCGLLQLTALKGLQEFTVEAGKWQRGDNLSIIIRPGPGRDIIFKTTSSPHPDVWYQLLLECGRTLLCQAPINEQLPGILQQLQDSGHGTTAFELARLVGSARVREAAVVAECKAAISQAEQQLQEYLDAN